MQEDKLKQLNAAENNLKRADELKKQQQKQLDNLKNKQKKQQNIKKFQRGK